VQGEAQGAVHRRLEAGHADLAVALGGVRVAAAEERAGHLDGQVERVPRVSWRVSMFPPKAPRRHDRLRAGAGGADAHRAHEGLDRDLDVLAEVDEVAVGQVEDPQVGIGEVVGQQPEPGQDGRPAPALRVEVEDLDRERVARLGAATAIGPASG
jgi:hypothetical protein